MKAVVGKRYRHYKGKEYTVLSIARNEASPHQKFVIYRAEYASDDFGVDCVWMREMTCFEERITVDGNSVERFSLIE